MTQDEIFKLDPIYTDEYIDVRDLGPGLINVTVKRECPKIKTSIEEKTPQQAQRICNILGCSFKQLEGYKIDDVKKELVSKQLKRNQKQVVVKQNIE
jgi:capsular polysaccharide biosynthesis protein